MMLLLAGTGEAVTLAQKIHAAGIPAVASLAGATRAPKALALPMRVGGFGGAEGFRAYLTSQKITAVLDATHPFAAQISLRSAEICAQMDLPYCQYLRPVWTSGPGDIWVSVTSEEAVGEHIPKGARVFLATGRQSLKRFQSLSDRYLICRQIDPPDGPFPFANGEYLVGRPPFSVADEMALFEQLKIDWLVVKNAGGSASYSKLEAARKLQIPVAMIKRPVQPVGMQVDSIEAAMGWVHATCR